MMDSDTMYYIEFTINATVELLNAIAAIVTAAGGSYIMSVANIKLVLRHHQMSCC